MILYHDCLLPILAHAKGKLFTQEDGGKVYKGNKIYDPQICA
jgi:hypothetical protein